jgi:hypothetical protein
MATRRARGGSTATAAAVVARVARGSDLLVLEADRGTVGGAPGRCADVGDSCTRGMQGSSYAAGVVRRRRWRERSTVGPSTVGRRRHWRGATRGQACGGRRTGGRNGNRRGDHCRCAHKRRMAAGSRDGSRDMGGCRHLWTNNVIRSAGDRMPTNSARNDGLMSRVCCGGGVMVRRRVLQHGRGCS